jgi:hypothetical protein
MHLTQLIQQGLHQLAAGRREGGLATSPYRVVDSLSLPYIWPVAAYFSYNTNEFLIVLPNADI